MGGKNLPHSRLDKVGVSPPNSNERDSLSGRKGYGGHSPRSQMTSKIDK